MKQIPHPQLDKATRLTAADLNKMKFDPRHTLLTPELLEKATKPAAQPAAPSKP